MMLQEREAELIEQASKCLAYIDALKIQNQNTDTLTELSEQITARKKLWELH